MDRRCTKCNKTFPLENFYKKTRSSDGIAHWCKECSNISARALMPMTCIDCGKEDMIRKLKSYESRTRCKKCTTIYANNQRKNNKEKYRNTYKIVGDKQRGRKKHTEEYKERLSQERTGIKRNEDFCRAVSEGRSKLFGDSSFNHLFSCYKASAIKRKKEWNLTKDEFKSIVSQNCYYCGSVPHREHNHNRGLHSKKLGFIGGGVDRVDNNKGYSVDNCVPCCTECNYAKGTQTLNGFRTYIKRVYKFMYE